MSSRSTISTKNTDTRTAAAHVQSNNASATNLLSSLPLAINTPQFVQRKCAHCDEEQVQRKPFIQRQENNGTQTASESIAQRIDASQGKGSPLSSSSRSFMESRFNTDFSDVRVHTDSYASQLSHELNAQAFTVGNDIYFNSGKFSEGTDQGKHLLAHELTHTIQQSTNIQKKIQREVAYDDRVISATEDATTHIWTGQMSRQQYVPAQGTTPRRNYSTFSDVRINFDRNNCKVILPSVFKFVHPDARNFPSCGEDMGVAIPATPLTAPQFTRLKTRVLDIARNWFNNKYTVSTPANCSHCAGRTISVETAVVDDDVVRNPATPDPTTVKTPVVLANKPGRSCASPGKITLHAPGGAIDDDRIIHELGHSMIGYYDEYPGNPNPATVETGDFSVAGDHSNYRSWMLLNPRHMSHVTAFLNHILNCNSTLNAVRQVDPNYRASLMLGGGSYNDIGSMMVRLGFDMNLPIDRMRRWQFLIGSHAHLILPLSSQNQTSFLAGARMGFSYDSDPSRSGLHASIIGEAGGGTFGVRSLTGRTQRETLPYLLTGAQLGYRTEPSTGARVNFGLEGAYGSTITAAPPLMNSQWFYIGLNLGVNFR